MPLRSLQGVVPKMGGAAGVGGAPKVGCLDGSADGWRLGLEDGPLLGIVDGWLVGSVDGPLLGIA